MGRYIRKVSSKGTTTTSESPHQMDRQHHYSIGVRTRARTLALLQKKTLLSSPPLADPNSYLQLRTRRLPKVLPLPQTRTSNEGHACKGPSSARKLPSCRGKVTHCCGGNPSLAMDDELELEASFGDNVLEPETGERSLRETTPCSPIMKSIIGMMPGSTTRRTASNSREKRIQVEDNQTVPSALAIEQFFEAEEQSQTMRFIEKYNYDPVNDHPMPGRYDWMRLDA